MLETEPHYRIFLLSGELTGSLEVDSNECELALLVLADVLDRIDVERHSKSMDRQDDGLRLAVDKYLD